MESGDELAAILKDLGFLQRAVITKDRDSYQLCECEVGLDKVSGLGNFIEVDAKMPEDEDVSTGKTQIFKFLNTIGVSENDMVDRPYLELYLAKMQGAGSKNEVDF